jgi:uncharacterized membrane-anchored protein YitT (DUF2179 family)
MRELTRPIVIFIGSLLIAIAYNQFLIPHEVLSAGISGIAIVVGLLTPFDTGLMNFILNLPLLILGMMKLGKRFILYTILSVIVLSTALYYLPVYAVSSDPILSSIFGGVLSGIGIGIILRYSGSTGGFDIIGMILAKKVGFPIGAILTGLNGIVILASGFLLNWDSALNTLVSIFITGKVIDSIHTQHMKLTVTIITDKGEEVRDKLLSQLYRGITIMDGEGGYTQIKRKIVMTVISRYELADMKHCIQEVDPQAFVNITQTVDVMGLFNRDQSKTALQMKNS